MIPFFKSTMRSLPLAALLALSISCQGKSGSSPNIEPKEGLAQGESLTRTAESGLTLQSSLTKAVYITEEYQETEEYTDYERECHTSYERQCWTEQDCYDGPSRRECQWIPGERSCHQGPGHRECHTVPGERECRWVPGDRQCHQERVCEPDRGERNCEMVRECGTNARGEEICKDRKVCHDSPPTERCDYREVCEPGRSEQVCDSTPDRQVCEDSPGEQICEQLPGREYCEDVPGEQICTPREVCNNDPREVCEDIPVRKTRTVTRYREVFSHNETLSITVLFPQGSELKDQETETFSIELNDSVQGGVAITQLSGVNKYEVIGAKRDGLNVTIQLDFVKEKESSDTNNEIKNVELLKSKQTFFFAFQDHGHRARMKTSFKVILRNADGKVISQATAVNAGVQLEQYVQLKETLTAGRYKYELTVTRDAEGTKQDRTFTKVGSATLK